MRRLAVTKKIKLDSDIKHEEQNVKDIVRNGFILEKKLDEKVSEEGVYVPPLDLSSVVEKEESKTIG